MDQVITYKLEKIDNYHLCQAIKNAGEGDFSRVFYKPTSF